MGIRQLQTFIQYSVPNGYVQVSLIDECEQFKRKKNQQPILLIDLMGLLAPMASNKKEVLCGLRQNVVYKELDTFLKKLSQIAELVFYEDGPVNDVKMNEWTKRQNERYDKSIQIIDQIYQNRSLDDIISFEKDLPSITSHLIITEVLAIKYGTLKLSLNRECDAEMAKYACENPRVLAILGDDSDFLIYPGNWLYFSLREMNQETLQTMKYNRFALRDHLQLNDTELILLSTLNGNDVIKFDDTYRFHKSLIQQRNNPTIRFPAIAQFIKDSKILQSRNFYREIAQLIYRSNSQTYVDRVRDSFEFYNVNFDIPPIQGELNKFCMDNFYDFTYSVLKYAPKTFTVHFFDLRDCSNYFNIVSTIFRKQIGIVLRFHPIKKGYEVRCRISHNDTFRSIYLDPIFPQISQPPLIELLKRSEYPQHDQTRFNLLKWVINEDRLKNVDLVAVPKNIFSDIMVLVFMTCEGFISPFEADIILLTIKHVELDIIPENLTVPDYLHPRAFIISFLFSKIYISISRSLEVTGLKSLLKLNNFDGVLFHNLYLKCLNEPFNMSFLLGDYTKYRHFA